MDLLVPNSGLLFWLTLVFLVVAFIVIKFGFPVIINMVNERKEFIDESLRKAHLLREATATRDIIVGKAQDKANEESTRIIAEARLEIANEKQNAFNDIRGQVAELSVKVAEKILREQLSDEKKQMELIEKLLDNVSSQ